jgi:hypothetical protein
MDNNLTILAILLCGCSIDCYPEDGAGGETGDETSEGGASIVDQSFEVGLGGAAPANDITGQGGRVYGLGGAPGAGGQQLGGSPASGGYDTSNPADDPCENDWNGTTFWVELAGDCLDCPPGWYDCNFNGEDGCETYAGERMNCRIL